MFMWISYFIFSFTYKKLNFDLGTSFLNVILSYIFIKYVESFTLDRLIVLYYLLVLYFLDNKNFNNFNFVWRTS